MPTEIFNGSVPVRVFDITDKVLATGVFSNNPIIYARFPSFQTQTIIWENAVPSLSGLTLNDLIGLRNISFTYSIQNTINASELSRLTEITFKAFSFAGQIQINKVYRGDPTKGAITNIDDTIRDISEIPNEFEYSLKCNCFGTEEIKGFRSTLTLLITMSVLCEGELLTVYRVCTEACSNCSAIECRCANAYIDACLTEGGTADNPPLIVENQQCRDFFAKYIEVNGTFGRFDRSVGSYCQSKYIGFADLFNPGEAPPSDVELCACHMQAELYRNFARDIFSFAPGISDEVGGVSFGIIDRCLVPACIISPFKHEPLPGKDCPIPQCINISSFNNDGTINKSNINIVQ